MASHVTLTVTVTVTVQGLTRRGVTGDGLGVTVNLAEAELPPVRFYTPTMITPLISIT